MTAGATAQPAVRLAEVSPDPLSVTRLHAAVAEPDAGAVVTFVGTVRNSEHAGGRTVTALEYSAHPSAARRLQALADGIVEASRSAAGVRAVRAVAVVHRVGLLAVGDLAIVVAAAAPHREEAFAACRDLLDAVTAHAPVWKRQVYADGTQDWVGVPVLPPAAGTPD